MASFFDTNILLYALHAAEKRKQAVARALIKRHADARSLVLSTQVLQEYFVNATRKFGLTAEEARGDVEQYAKARIIQVSPELILEAIDLHRLHSVSLWDSLVVCAARAAKCGELFSEDLQAGQVLGGVRVVNPFAA